MLPMNPAGLSGIRTRDKSRLSSKHIIIICSVFLILGLAVLGISLYIRSSEIQAFESLSWETVSPDFYDPNAYSGDLPEEIAQHEDPAPAKDTFHFYLNSKPYLADGSLHGLYARNCSGNRGNMTVTLLLMDNTVLYQSGLLLPNQYLDTVPCSYQTSLSLLDAVAVIQVYGKGGGKTPVDTFTQPLEITVLQ